MLNGIKVVKESEKAVVLVCKRELSDSWQATELGVSIFGCTIDQLEGVKELWWFTSD